MADEAAALHLFRVAAGLDSLVPGEGEILGQVRDAFEAGAHGPVLDRLFRQALHVGKKVRTETAIDESPASVSSAAAALAQQVFGELDGLPGAARRGRRGERARRPGARRARRDDRGGREPDAGERAEELADAFRRRTRFRSTQLGGGARPRRRRRLVDELARTGHRARSSRRPRTGRVGRCS